MATKTMGQALDAALQYHAERFPEADVYEATVESHSAGGGGYWTVTVDAAHFSVPLAYRVGDDVTLQ